MTARLLFDRSKRLSELTAEDFAEFSAWSKVPCFEQDLDSELAPVQLEPGDLLPRLLEATWCLTTVLLACGRMLPGCSVCFPAGHGGPLGWSLHFEGKYWPISLPPAPPEALKLVGPQVLAESLRMPLLDVMPMTLTVLPMFELTPHRRSVILDITGVVG